MIKEKLIELIGEYVTTEYSWLDIPWIFGGLIVLLAFYLIGRGIFYFAKGVTNR